jgi:hypothetical protein
MPHDKTPPLRGQDASRAEGVRLLACDIVERRSGMPGYLADDEAWTAAVAEAEATYTPPRPLSPVEDAIRRAEGKHLTDEEIERSIGALNRASAVVRSAAAHHQNEEGATDSGRDALAAAQDQKDPSS